jgi:hypothetical protein
LNTVNSFLYFSTNDLGNRLLHNDLIIIRKQGVDHGGDTGHQEGAGEPRRRVHQRGETIQLGISEFDFRSNSESITTSPSN